MTMWKSRRRIEPCRVSRWGTLALALAVLVGLAARAPDRPAVAQDASAQEPGLTVEELRAGGYVIFFRHVTADDGADQSPMDLENCATQRNIREQGLREARAIGQAFRLLDIPVGTVMSSEYCRALETAAIAFGRADPNPWLNLCCFDARPISAEERLAFVARVVTITPPRGANTVIAAHGVGIVQDLAMGEAAIYRPDGVGGAERVARVLPNEWMNGVYTLTR